MATQHFRLFDTAIGACALVWEGERIIGAQLPERDEATARRRLARRFPEAEESRAAATSSPRPWPTSWRCSTASRAISSHLPIDSRRGLRSSTARSMRWRSPIPPGETLTYGEVAARIGDPGAARAVGVALGQNPWPIIVPCHRVLAAGGKTGGFSADGGVETKLRMLTIEKARTSAEPSLFDALPLAAKPAPTHSTLHQPAEVEIAAMMGLRRRRLRGPSAAFYWAPRFPRSALRIPQWPNSSSLSSSAAIAANRSTASWRRPSRSSEASLRAVLRQDRRPAHVQPGPRGRPAGADLAAEAGDRGGRCRPDRHARA